MLPHPVRRLLTPLLMAVAAVLMIVAAAACIVGLVAALMDRRARILRLAVLLGVYTALEVVVPVLLLGIWVLRVVRAVDETFDVRAVGWALDVLFGVARVVCGFRVEIEEPSRSGPFDHDEPVLVLARHGGLGDSFALAHLLISECGRRPKVVLHRMLSWDPMVDVAMTRLGACWIGRSSAGSSRAAIGRLVADLRARDALLLFPEGRNWTPRRRLSVMARLWKAGRTDELKVAALMERVLPPTSGGVVACLNARPDIPVVVMAHAGLDRITSMRGLWRALPFSVPMRLRWWAASPAPLGDDDRSRWLTTEWAIVEEWIEGSAP